MATGIWLDLKNNWRQDVYVGSGRGCSAIDCSAVAELTIWVIANCIYLTSGWQYHRRAQARLYRLRFYAGGKNHLLRRRIIADNHSQQPHWLTDYNIFLSELVGWNTNRIANANTPNIMIDTIITVGRVNPNFDLFSNPLLIYTSITALACNYNIC